MATLTVYRLTFRGGFHLGAHGVNLEESAEHIPSDTLFAALVDAALRTGAGAEDFSQPFREGDPPFLLTSAFPFAGSVRFFPMPVPLDRWFGPETLRERSKDLKKVRFVSEALFRRMLDGERMDGWLFPEDEQADPERGVALQGGVFWLTVEEAQSLPDPMRIIDPATRRAIAPRALRYHRVFASGQVPRVTLDRMTSASSIFHAGRVSFSPGCGLWFGVCWRTSDAALQGLVLQALTVLADDGLGGERTVGYGGFWWEDAGSLTLPDPADGGLLWLLSRYHPRSAELPGALTDSPGYTLTAVAGWLRSWQGAAQRRQRLWLVAEGSLIRAVGSGPWGDLTDVRPRYRNPEGDLPHPIWRYGFALGAAAVAPDGSGISGPSDRQEV
ncbi:MAG: type III-A CRISPR-associated RAMP protein Csm4 [Anaerolineae bacterium]|jgi:CRISPR-associated protein Csm4